MMMKTIDERSILETTSSLKIIECSNSSLSSSTTSSSIGNNSDTHDQNDDYDDIQSPYYYNNNIDSNNNGSGSSSSSSSFDDAIQALEQALPIRRGISTFYNGKSKSFTNLNNEWPTTPISIQDSIAKPETPFTRKRRNLSNFKLPYMNTGRISKKSKATTLHFTLEREKVNQHNFGDHGALSQIKRPLPSRSFSMVNLLR